MKKRGTAPDNNRSNVMEQMGTCIDKKRSNTVQEIWCAKCRMTGLNKAPFAKIG
jgi:hypothetical protein